MKRIVHISDLHFGTEATDIVPRLQKTVDELQANLIVISGDFTQIASNAEFKKAQDFIASLARPVFCVPGNHDIPRFNVAERLLNPSENIKNL